MTPCDGAETIEITSPLFTDYAEKQRIMLLPKGHKMQAHGNGLPDFPDGTIIAKTFFYRNGADTADRLHIVETRLLIKNQSQWNASTYKWNDAQDEAFLLEDGATVQVDYRDEKGNNGNTAYKIPTKSDCISCHRQNDKIFPIGLKLRNINKDVNRGQQTINQLKYLKEKGKLEIADTVHITSVADYRDENAPLENRARTYLDINCAHCHNPKGIAYMTLLDLRMETPVSQSGIWLKQGKIALRITTTGEMHMPKIGTTIPHKEGVKLMMDYIDNLK